MLLRFSPLFSTDGDAPAALPAEGAFAALTAQTFDENDGVQTYTFAAATGTDLTWTYGLAGAPTSITLDSATRTISYDTTALEPGTLSFIVLATDQFNRTITQDTLVTITAAAAVPELASATNDSVFWTIDAAVTAYDITQNFTLNGNSGTYAVTGLPAGLSVVSSEIVGTPTVASTGTVVITFTDSFGRETASSLAFEVGAAPAIFSNFHWVESTGVLAFDATQAGTYTWNFGAASGTFDLVAGANEPAINLSAYAGQTAAFSITRGGQTLAVDSALTVPGSASLVEPVILDFVISGTNSAVASFTADYPAHSAGDLLIVITANDNNDTFLGPVVVSGISGETVYEERAIVGNDIDDSNEQTLAIHSFVANATRSAGTGILVDAANTDQYVVGVIVVDAGTFKDTAPRLGSIVKTQENTTASASATGAITAAQESALPFAAFNYAFNSPTGGAPSGWTQEGLTDIGALVLQVLTRNTATTDGENVAATTVSGNTNSNWIGLTGLILPNGA